MKAEQRKALETNFLADRMGRVVKRMKERPKRSTVLYVVLGLVVVVAILVFVMMRRGAARQASANWVELEDGHRAYIARLVQEAGETNAGKAANFQFAWLRMWELGLKRLAADPAGARDSLKSAQKMYKLLAEQCADDPVLGPEALYNVALIEESLAVEDRDNLKSARKRYQEVVDKYKDSAHAKKAEERVKLLEPDSRSYREIADFYADLQASLRVRKDDIDLKRLLDKNR
jgi:hypothetical protein